MKIRKIPWLLKELQNLNHDERYEALIGIVLGGGVRVDREKIRSVKGWVEFDEASSVANVDLSNLSRRVPEEFEITARSIAYWSSLHCQYKINKGIRYWLITNGYTKEEFCILQGILARKFSIYTGIHKYGNSWRFYIYGHSVQNFIKTIRPYLLDPAMKEKVHLDWYDNQEPKDMSRTLRIQHRKRLSKVQKEVLVGTLLGNATVRNIDTNDPRKNTLIEFTQELSKRNYIYHLMAIFKDYIQAAPTVFQQSKSTFLRLRTLRHPEFREYRYLFYNNENRKTVPLNLQQLLTVRGLAYWAVTIHQKKIDSNSVIDQKLETQFYFSTRGFQLNDYILLQKVLLNKFKLHTTIQKTEELNSILVLSKQSLSRFYTLIKPYLVTECMKKKVAVLNEYQ